MKVVILAGGFGTRLGEETTLKPKPMLEIGGMPIIWHIMKIYSSQGFTDFIICLGYKGYIIKEFFSNYFLYNSDLTIDLATNSIQYHDSSTEPWRITLVNTGLNSMTGGRIKRIQNLVDDTFMLTYGDGVGDIDLAALLNFHAQKKQLCTVTAVQPTGRFGALNLDKSDDVMSFSEKPKGDGAWVNGGFFVCERGVFDYIDNDSTTWEQEPMEHLAVNRQLNAYKHNGYWKPMDTPRDKQELEQEWNNGTAKWKIW